jgi:hypothetical protein
MAFQNLNNCFSFSVSANSLTPAKLSAFPCSEVVITNPTGSGQLLLIYDNGFTSDARAFAINSGDTVSIRGVTSSDMLSAKFAANPTAPSIYCRAQYYSFSTQSYA